MRTTMKQERYSDLFLLFIKVDIEIDLDGVVEDFNKQNGKIAYKEVLLLHRYYF